jgi:hypothetical protein
MTTGRLLTVVKIALDHRTWLPHVPGSKNMYGSEGPGRALVLMADSDSESDELPQLENAMQQLHHARAHGTHNAAFLEDVILNDVGLAAHVLLRFNATTPVVAITDEILLLWAQATSGGFTVYPRLADWWCDIDDRFEGSFPSIFFAMNPPDARACRFLLEDLLVVTLVAIEFESNRPISCAYRDHRLYTPPPPGGMNMYGSEGPMEVSMRLQKQSWSLCSTRLPSADEWEAELDLCSNVKNSKKSPTGSSTIKDSASKVRAKCIPQVPPIKATKGSRSAERIRAIERAKKEVELSLNRKELIAKMLAWQPIVEP